MSTTKKAKKRQSAINNIIALHSCNTPPNVTACGASAICPLRDVMERQVAPPTALLYGIVTDCGDIVRGLRDVRATNIQLLTRILNQLSYDLHDMHVKAIEEQVAAEERRSQIKAR